MLFTFSRYDNLVNSQLLNTTRNLLDHTPPCLQNTVLKTWQGKPENVGKAQEALLIRAKANSDAQRGQYDPASEGSTEAAQSMYQKGYQY